MENSIQSIEHLFKQLQEEKRPPVHRWQPTACGEIGIQIKRNGDWFYQDSLIQRPAMVRLFSTLLRREGDAYFLVTPQEKLQIKVDDAPFTAVSVQVLVEAGQQYLVFTNNVGNKVIAGKDNPIFIDDCHKDGKPSPYIEVRDNLNALIVRSAYYHLATHCIERNGYYGVWSDRCFFALAKTEN